MRPISPVVATVESHERGDCNQPSSLNHSKLSSQLRRRQTLQGPALLPQPPPALKKKQSLFIHLQSFDLFSTMIALQIAAGDLPFPSPSQGRVEQSLHMMDSWKSTVTQWSVRAKGDHLIHFDILSVYLRPPPVPNSAAPSSKRYIICTLDPLPCDHANQFRL